MNNWYVISVWTGNENSCVKNIQKYNREKSIYDTQAFVPTREVYIKKNGNFSKNILNMFPGYTFVETPMCSEDFFRYSKELRRIFHVPINVLRYGESNEIAIRWEERLPLMELMKDEWCVKTSLGFKENDKVKIVEGPLVGHEGQIIEIDRHNKKAVLEIVFNGRMQHIPLGLQVLKQMDFMEM